MGLAAALIVTTLALFSAVIAWKMGCLRGKVGKDTSDASGEQGAAEQGAVEPTNSGELTRSGSPASHDVDTALKKKASHLSLRSLRSFGSLSGLYNVENQMKGWADRLLLCCCCRPFFGENESTKLATFPPSCIVNGNFSGGGGAIASITLTVCGSKQHSALNFNSRHDCNQRN